MNGLLHRLTFARTPRWVAVLVTVGSFVVLGYLISGAL